MKKHTLLMATAMAVVSSPALAQFAPGDTTDYETASVSIWTEDKANDVVEYADQFACIVKNSRGDLFGNGEWEALIDEGDCFGAESDSRSGPQYARALMSSTRASETAEQEVAAFFTSTQEGSETRFIANVTGRQSQDDAPPFGDWSFSYYLNSSSELPGVEATAATTPAFGYVDVSEDEANNSIRVLSADVTRDPLTSSIQGTMRSVIDYNRGTDTLEFIGVTADGSGQGDIVAGKASADYYFRAEWNDVDTTDFSAITSSPTTACVARDNTFQTVHKYGLYNEDGSAVSLSGGFGFSYGTNEARGYAGSWGVWLEDDAGTFSPGDDATLSITAQDDDGNDVTRSLSWAGGKTYKNSVVTEALTNGTSYLTWTMEGEAVATWNSGSSQFDLTPTDDQITFNDTSLTAAEVQSEPWLGFFWSNEKQASVNWDGSTNVTFFMREDVSSDTTLLSATSTKMLSVNSGAPSANLPISRTSATSQNYKGDSNVAAGEVYFLTGAEPGDSYEPRTLYHDTDASGDLSTGDSAVRYDFSVSSMTGEYTDFSDDSSAAYNGFWPYDSVTLILDSEDGTGTCTVSSPSDCTQYDWTFGAYSWDNSILVYEGTELYQIDDPIRFQYTFDASEDDRNPNNSDVSFVTDSQYNPVSNLCTVENGSSDCDVSPDDLDGKKYYLEYDGTSLHGLPGVETGVGDGWGHWIQLINLADGVQLTASDADSTTYRVKALEISETFNTSDPSNCTTAGITVSEPDDMSISPDDLPSTTTPVVALPTQAWSDAPSDDDLICTVTHGDASACPTN